MASARERSRALLERWSGSGERLGTAHERWFSARTSARSAIAMAARADLLIRRGLYLPAPVCFYNNKNIPKNSERSYCTLWRALVSARHERSIAMAARIFSFAQTPYPGQEGKDINAQSSSAAHQLSDINTYSKQ